MRKVLTVTMLSMLLMAATIPAYAEEVKMVGTITKIEMKGASAVATLKDTKSGDTVEITINDELTLDKFKDHRIVEGDEIRCKYETESGANVSKLFRKTAGC